jgi:LacI family transcriptional regulator
LQVTSEYEAGRQIVEGVLDYAEQCGGWDFIFDSKFNPRFPFMHAMDAMIAEVRDPHKVKLYRRLKFPVVAVTGMAAAGRLPLVSVDNEAIGRMAAHYFLEMGYEDLAYFTRNLHVPDGRRDGFVAVAQNAGRKVHAFPVTPAFSNHTSAYREKAVIEWLRSLPWPMGLFTYSDHDALDVANAAGQGRVRVPEDVAILGVDSDTLLCRLCHPPLSSIDHSAKQIGYQAAAILDRIMHGQDVGMSPVLLPPTTVIDRQSTDTLAIRDPDTVAALRMIRREACDGLRADDVVRGVNISRTSLETRFHKLLGRSVHQEIVRVRLEKAKHLLRTTDLAMPEITDICCFGYPSQLSHIFRRELHMTPGQYRKQHRMG